MRNRIRTATPASKRIKNLKDKVTKLEGDLRMEIHHREQTSEALSMYQESNKKLRRTMGTVRMRAEKASMIALSLKEGGLYHDMWDIIEILNDELDDGHDSKRAAIQSTIITNKKNHGACGKCGELDCGGMCS